jgi:hypothetical protein
MSRCGKQLFVKSQINSTGCCPLISIERMYRRSIRPEGASIGIDSLLGEGTMPAAYSAYIRGRVIASVESGSSRREAAEEFDVSASSAIKWVAAYWKLRGQAAGRQHLATGEVRELFADAD